MDFVDMLRHLLGVASQDGAGDNITRAKLNQEGLDPIDPATGQLTPGGVAPIPAVSVNVAPAPNQMGTRPLNAQEALQRGDPGVAAILRRRQQGMGAVPAPVAPMPVSYGAQPLR